MSTTLYLVRHAESAPDFTLAESDWPLSANGVAEAERLAAYAASFGATRLIASPYRRAVATLEPLARRLNLPIRTEFDLRERHLRDGYVENWDALLVQLWRDLDARMPNCESGTHCRQRVVRRIDALAREFAGETFIACSHGNAIALFLGSIDVGVGYDAWKHMRNVEIFRLRHSAAGWTWDRDYARPWT
jgi:2,3-bisphosphoglycerate-dependent phosphoglycerate mutase